MMGELVVFGSVALAVAFALAWAMRSDVRQWLEAPKHGFDENVRRYDRDALDDARLASDRESDPVRFSARAR